MKNWRKRNTLNAPPPNHDGRINGQYVSIRVLPISALGTLLNIRNFGMRTTSSGRTRVLSNTMNIASRPGHLNRAKP